MLTCHVPPFSLLLLFLSSSLLQIEVYLLCLLHLLAPTADLQAAEEKSQQKQQTHMTVQVLESPLAAGIHREEKEGPVTSAD